MGMSKVSEMKCVLPNQTILLIGFVGLKGSLDILRNNETELKERFPRSFLNQMKNLESLLFWLEDTDALDDSTRVYPLGSGGIYTTLWQVCQDFHVGHVVDVSKISICQETIEICEYYRLNPYRIDSEGCYLIFTHNPKEITRQFEKQKMKVAIIGKINDTKRKEIKRGEEICSLPKMTLQKGRNKC